MKYVGFIWADGRPAPDELAVMQREIPGWVEEMDGRHVRLLGRELELPETAATIRVRDGETLVTDGPFAETKEFMAGFDVLECADLDEALEVAAKHASSWVQAIEIRPFRGALSLGEQAEAFAHDDDSAGPPYLVTMWVDEAAATGTLTREIDAWRQDLEARGAHVLGGELEGPEAATTVRVRGGEARLSDGPAIDAAESLATIDIVRCAGRQQAIELAAAHPAARVHTIEVRPFYSE